MRDDGSIAGFSALDPDEAVVWALFVDPAYGGRGIGRALLERLMTAATRAGLIEVTLTTTAGTRAERMYRKAGFTTVAIAGEDRVARCRPG